MIAKNEATETRRVQRWRLVKRAGLPLSSLCSLWLFFAVPEAGAQDAAVAPAEAPVVERVEIQGNQFVPADTLLYYVSTKAGDRYDEHRLREDFRRLWDTGFLDDMRVDALDTPNGKRVVFTIKERKRVQIVDFRGSKALTNTAIEDELKKKDASLRIDSFYEPGKARRVEAIIKEMLVEKGRPFGTVKHDAKSVGGAGTQVSFIIDDGPPARVRRIDFSGNQVFTDAELRATMKKVKASGRGDLVSLFTGPTRWGKTNYTEDKWADPQEGDRGRLLNKYLNHGYVTATVGEPRITYTDGKAGFFKKKPVKWMNLEVPVTEGEQYRVGTVEFQDMTVFRPEALRPLLKLETGDVYNESRFKKLYDKLRDAYGAQGYFQWTPLTERKPDPARKVVDVVMRMDEDKKYYVSRIKFVGNDTTRDKVIRREVYLNEGDVFNTEALKLSIRRINQLGYFKQMEGPPEISPSQAGDDRLDVTFKVEEQNRNQFTFGGGVSGLEGTFINASFSTANFLGLGETFQISAQSGRRTKNYQLAVTEPYLFDRPITAGFDLYHRRLTYETFPNVVGYTEERTGGALVFGVPVGRFSRVFANYSYEFIDIRGLETLLGLDPSDPTQPVFDPFFLGESGRRRESRLTPTFVHNTVDNPWTPRSGVKYTSSVQVAGGILGGTVNYMRPDLEAVVYVPHFRKTALGLRGQLGYIKPFGDTRSLPYYQRFFLGGETQIRGYQVRSVGPFNEDQTVALGGNKYAVFNAEYYFDIGGPLRFLLFFDAGQAFLEGDNIRIQDFRTSTGAELRFIMPVLNVPFRLIYAINPNRDAFQKRSNFQFAVGTTF
jgi:outer membrane protein insertion porin family